VTTSEATACICSAKVDGKRPTPNLSRIGGVGVPGNAFGCQRYSATLDRRLI